METTLLQEFIVLAEVKNYLLAADSLFISQPTLSRHIKRLEEELGVSLLERGSRQLELTPEGQQFLPYARQIVSLEQEYQSIFRRSAENSSSLNIGSIPMMAPYGISDIIQRFHKMYPDILLTTNILSRREMIQALEEGRIDYAFLREFGRPGDDLLRIPIAQDCIIAVLPKTHPLAQEKVLHLQQLKKDKMIFPAGNSETYNRYLQACREAGFEPQITISGKGPETAIDLVARGMGVALSEKLPCEYVDKKDQVVLIDIDPPVRINISAAYRNGEKGEAAQTFLTFLRQCRQGVSIFRESAAP